MVGKVKRWIVTALGVEGSEFVYAVTADTSMLATRKAYGAHGLALREGRQVEPLGPFSTTEEVSDE